MKNLKKQGQNWVLFLRLSSKSVLNDCKDSGTSALNPAKATSMGISELPNTTYCKRPCIVSNMKLSRVLN